MSAAWELPLASHGLTDRLGWMLCHSLWQFAAVALVLALLLRLCRSPQVRYALGCCALLATVVLAVVTFAALQAAAGGGGINQVASSGVVPGAEHQPPPDDGSARTTLGGGAGGSLQGISLRVGAWRSRAGDALRPWLSWIVAAWCLGVCVLSMRPICGWCTMRRLRREGLSAVSGEISATLARVARRLGVGRPVRIAASVLIEVPAVIGYLRPLILLPLSAASGLSSRQLEAVLAHELAHIRRHDFLVNCLQTVIESAFFYHPAVWWISHQVRREREDCCDDVAIALCDDRVGYARALIELEELRGPASAAALAANGGSIVGRVRRILRATPARSGSSGMTAAAALLAAALTLAAVSWLPAAPPPGGERLGTDGPLTGSDRATTTPALDAALAPAQPPAGWFRPNPFPELGLIRNAGPGWQFVRLASGGRSSAVLGIDAATRDRLQALYFATLKDDTAIAAQLRSEGRFHARMWTAARSEHWNQARRMAEAWISPRQAAQIERLMIQQQGYHAFLQDEVAAQLELSPGQRQQVAARVREHHARIAANHAARDREIAALQADPGAATPERLREVRAETVQAGLASHRRAWNEIYAALRPGQRQRFEELRGPAVTFDQDSTQPALADNR